MCSSRSGRAFINRSRYTRLLTLRGRVLNATLAMTYSVSSRVPSYPPWRSGHSHPLRWMSSPAKGLGGIDPASLGLRETLLASCRDDELEHSTALLLAVLLRIIELFTHV